MGLMLTLKGLFFGFGFAVKGSEEEFMAAWKEIENTEILDKAALLYCIQRGLIDSEEVPSLEDYS